MVGVFHTDLSHPASSTHFVLSVDSFASKAGGTEGKTRKQGLERAQSLFLPNNNPSCLQIKLQSSSSSSDHWGCLIKITFLQLHLPEASFAPNEMLHGIQKQEGRAGFQPQLRKRRFLLQNLSWAAQNHLLPWWCSSVVPSWATTGQRLVMLGTWRLGQSHCSLTWP